jgi:outer membrane protein assembly factor BamA
MDFTISGTQSMSSDDLDMLTATMVGGCYDEDSDELETWVQSLFQDKGYARADVQSLHIIPLDPTKMPKPVRIETEVVEGNRYRVNEVMFSGNHHFESEKLRKAFPLKKGDLFSRERIVAGLVEVRKLYTSDGYLDCVMIPDFTNMAETTLDFSIEVREGTQYKMGKLDVYAKKENADRLRAAWGLAEGSVYDQSYVDKFIDEHHALLPAAFTRADIQTIQDCPDGTAEVRLIVDPIDAASHPSAEPVKCEKPEQPKR